MFLARTKTAEEWKAMIGAVQTLVDEATFEANSEGILFRGMDPSHIALIDIFWPSAGFERFECDSQVKFGVKIDEFGKLIRRGEKKDSITIDLTDDSMLRVELVNGYKRSYKTRIIKSSASNTPLPKLNFQSKVIMTSALFDKVLTDVQTVSEYLTIATTPGKVDFSGRGDSAEANITIESGSEGLEEIVSPSEETKATYSIDYLSKITKAVLAVGGSVVTEFSAKMPVRLEFRLAQVGRIHFYLAPRVTD